MRGSAVFRTGVAPGGALAGPWVQNSLWTRARAVPSLDLRFADNKSLVDATTGSNLVTFTRASSGTYVGSDGVLRSAVTNAPRFDHNPTTGKSLGLLVEEARTNSSEWSNSATQGETWSSVGTNLDLASGQSDPAGGTAGIRATDANSASGGTFLQRTSLANLTASTTVTYSVWLKPIDCPNNVIILNVFANTTTDAINAIFSVSGTAITEVSTSAIGTGAASGASFEVFPNGWYRCLLTGVPSTVTMADVRARIALGSYQRAAGTARFDWYGAQLESGAFATSYIPTTGATATRAADVASITGSNFSSWYRQDEGTVFVNGITPPNRANFPSLNTLHDGTSNNRLLQYVFTSGYFSAARVGSVPQGDNTAAVTPTDGSAYKVASAFAVNNSVTAVNGVTGSVDTLCLMPTALNTLAIGAEWNNANIVNSTIRRLTYWPTRLSNEVLQRITQ